MKSKRSGGEIRIETSILKRAKRGDAEAIATMFRQFIPEDEPIAHLEYLGLQGVLIGTTSFGCLTPRRVASIRVSSFGEVIYQDGYLEYINSGIIYQPSKLGLYIMTLLVLLLTFAGCGLFIKLGLDAGQRSASADAILSPMYYYVISALTSVLGFLFLILVPRVYYRFVKCGLVYWIREGVNVYLFTNRSRLYMANRMYRAMTLQRESRVRQIGHGT